jgi:hypothetical protein
MKFSSSRTFPGHDHDRSGHTLNPSSVLQSTLDKLVQVKNAADRMRLEYLLLGSRMSLKERRQFDDYCVTAAPQRFTASLPAGRGFRLVGIFSRGGQSLQYEEALYPY